MTLDNLNGTPPNRPTHSGGVNRQQRAGSAGSPVSSPQQLHTLKNDQVQITSQRYSNDLEFALEVYDKLETASIKKLKSIQIRYAGGLHNTDEMQSILSETLARTLGLEQLHEHITGVWPENLSQLTPERQYRLIHSDEVLRVTIEKLSKDLNNL